jgi:hypothetical protein
LILITQTLNDCWARSTGTYRTTWPEKITRVFLDPPGAAWDERISVLIASQMEVCLHTLCLENLRDLVSFTKQYAEISRLIFKERLSLTYVPPALYQKAMVVQNEWHPFFRICVGVEFNCAVFDPETEVDIEAFLAAADAKSLRTMLRAKHFSDVISIIRTKLEASVPGGGLVLAPDGGAHGGAPTASSRAMNFNFMENAIQAATIVSSSIDMQEEEEREMHWTHGIQSLHYSRWSK